VRRLRVIPRHDPVSLASYSAYCTRMELAKQAKRFG
jgi:hypothetical protein